MRALLSFCGRPHVLQRSIAFLVFVSIYANVMGHWSSWQAARVEVRQDDAS